MRITAQLVQADSGANVWTESYDRELTGVFVLQEDIARAVAASLRAPLGLQQGQTLVSSRTGDLDSYQQYLRARALFRARNNDEALAVLEPLVTRDPTYAPAWALLASAYLSTRFRGDSVEEERRIFQAAMEKAERAAREAIRLDPNYAGGYGRLGNIVRWRGEWALSDDLRRQALALDPTDTEVLEAYSVGLAVAGHLKESLRLREQIRTLEPFVPAFNIATAYVLQLNGQSEAAIRMLESVPLDAATGYERNLRLAGAYATAGRYAEAADALLAIPREQTEVTRQAIESAARLLRSAPAKVSAPETLPTLESGLDFVYLHIGADERRMENLMENAERDLAIGIRGTSTWWFPAYAPLRKTARFKAYVRNAGLLDYWRERGWPDLCRPVGGDDFECD